MDENPNKTADAKRTELSIRSAAIDMAIRSNVGMKYDEEGRSIVDANRVVEAAKKFETFIKG